MQNYKKQKYAYIELTVFFDDYANCNDINTDVVEHRTGDWVKY